MPLSPAISPDNQPARSERRPTPYAARALACYLLLLASVAGTLGTGTAIAASETNGGGPSASRPAHHFLNLSLFHPVATNQDPEISTSLRWAFIYGRVGAVHGLNLNSGVSLIERDLRGGQVTVLYSQVGGEFRGVAATGLVNHFHGDGKGIQMAGLLNFDRDHFRGFQYGGLFNFTEAGFSGVQTTSLFNLNEGDGGFLQAAAVANVTAGSFRGVQFAGGFNYANQDIRGLQMATSNFAERMSGLQLGAVNIAGEFRGVQIGLVNVASQHHGLPLGLLNLAGNGQVEWVTYGSSLAAINTGVRTTVNGWSSMLSMGGGDLSREPTETIFASWHLGRVLRQGRTWRLDADIGFLRIMPIASDDEDVDDRVRAAFQLRLLVERRFSPQVAAFVGIGISTVSLEDKEAADATEKEKSDPLLVAGMALF